MEVEKFTFLKVYADSISKLAELDENLAKELTWKIFQYGIYGIIEESENPAVEAIFIQIKVMIDKGKEISKQNSENGKRGGRGKKQNESETKAKQKQTKSETKAKQKQTKSETKAKKSNIEHITYNIEHKTENIEQEDILTSKDVKTEIKISEGPPKDGYGNELINQLIILIKDKCNELGIAYDKQKERQYGKLILTGKDFGAFCEKIGQTREEFAINILIASAKIGFWKGICSGPMKIYLNYAEVYNETVKQHSKNQKNLIQSF